MATAFIVFHYPRPEHVEDFVARTRQVRDVLLTQPGCLSANVWVTPDHDAVVTTGQFESATAYRAAFDVARCLGDVVAFDDRERQERKVVTLIDPQRVNHGAADCRALSTQPWRIHAPEMKET